MPSSPEIDEQPLGDLLRVLTSHAGVGDHGDLLVDQRPQPVLAAEAGHGRTGMLSFAKQRCSTRPMVPLPERFGPMIRKIFW